jgi:hypothetical protein
MPILDATTAAAWSRSARRVARVATGRWRARHLRIDANAGGEYDEPSPDWGRPLVVGRDHPSWPEVDAEQRGADR